MRVVIAEDDPLSLGMLQHRLTLWGYEVVAAGDGDEAWQILERDDGPSMAILDWMMPGLDGVELCRRIRERGREPYVYVILATRRNHPADVVLGLEAGADDFVTKPFHTDELLARIRAGERIVGLQARLLTLATHDALTGLWNRYAILDALTREMNRAARERSPLSVAMADLDHFKLVNDGHGHPAGDVVLQEVARRMRGTLRNYDLIGRYGGEEFLVLLPSCDAETARRVADHVRTAVGAEPIALEGTRVRVTVSLGVASFAGDRQIDPRLLVEAADEVLYQAKSRGRDQIVVAREPISCDVRVRERA
jgi:diguanylate cyclase (GGDEF)-like protein